MGITLRSSTQELDRCDQEAANGYAWQEGMRRLDEAMATGQNHSFETTLGGRTITAKILEATKTHDVLIWFCGLSSAELHIARVQARVAAGGHPIPEEKIRERHPQAQLNLIRLMPHSSQISVYDNSTEANADGTVHDPLLIFEMQNGHLLWPTPDDLEMLQSAPEWARSILEAALQSPPSR